MRNRGKAALGGGETEAWTWWTDTVGNSLGTTPLESSETEAWTSRTDRKLWEIALGESSVGRARDIP